MNKVKFVCEICDGEITRNVSEDERPGICFGCAIIIAKVCGISRK